MTGSIERHYTRGAILDTVLQALAASGKDVRRLSPADLAPVDEFHIRGREATIELAERAGLEPGMDVLDVGCGLGGSVRYLAAERGCRATGVDLTAEYVHAATALAERVGLAGRVSFRQASALDLPFPARSFDAVWTEHAQMNIADKRRFYAEIARVLRPGGRLAFHDVFQGEQVAVYPLPWAEDASMSFLVPAASARKILSDLGFDIVAWADLTQRSLDWFEAALGKMRKTGPAPLGLHLLMGDTARLKFQNVICNLREKRIAVVQAVAALPAD